MSNSYEPNPRKHEFRSTGLETYLTCPRKWYIEYLLRLESSRARIAADFGSAIHDGVAAFYRREGVVQAVKAFTLSFQKLGDEKRNLASGTVALTRYCQLYAGTEHTVDPKEVEIRFRLGMPNGTYLTGTLDRIVRDGNGIFFHDTKTTTSALTDWFWARYMNSFQFGAYDYALTQLLGRCDGGVVDAINVAPSKSGEMFDRRPMMRTELQRGEWLNTYLAETDRLAASIPSSGEVDVRKFVQRPVSCDKFGGCVYLGACRFGLSHPSVAVELTDKPAVDNGEAD